jgi:hypothetical protein
VINEWASPPDIAEYANPTLPFSILEKYRRDPSVRSTGNRSIPMSPGKMESDEVIWVNGSSTGLTGSENTQPRIAKMTTTTTAMAETPSRQDLQFHRGAVPSAE